MARLANKLCRAAVLKQSVFQNSNETLFSELRDSGKYVVYSYGHHYPLYGHVPGKGWFENVTPSSRTTARHRTLCRPTVDTTPLNTREMKELLGL